MATSRATRRRHKFRHEDDVSSALQWRHFSGDDVTTGACASQWRFEIKTMTSRSLRLCCRDATCRHDDVTNVKARSTMSPPARARCRRCRQWKWEVRRRSRAQRPRPDRRRHCRRRRRGPAPTNTSWRPPRPGRRRHSAATRSRPPPPPPWSPRFADGVDVSVDVVFAVIFRHRTAAYLLSNLLSNQYFLTFKVLFNNNNNNNNRSNNNELLRYWLTSAATYRISLCLSTPCEHVLRRCAWC